MSIKVSVERGVPTYIVNQEATKQARIAELKQLLKESDFKTLPDYDQDATQVLVQRQAWREEIRQLELEVTQ